MSQKTIGIDLGSNTLRAVEYDCDLGEFGGSFGAIVKTADGLANTGIISEGAVERIIAGLDEMQAAIDFTNAKVRAVTTEAMRRAANRDEVLERISKETGVQFELIGGDEEARLTLDAVSNRLDMLKSSTSEESYVLIDIGGGSTELIFAYGDETVSRSFSLGIVTVSQSYDSLDAIREALPQMMEPMDKFVSEVYAKYGKPDIFTATAGTPTTVASMKLGLDYVTYDPKAINGTTVYADEPQYYLDKLLSMPFEQREFTVGVGRSDLVTAGIVMFEELYSILGFEECTVIDDGLREGVAVELCSKLKIKN